VNFAGRDVDVGGDWGLLSGCGPPSAGVTDGAVHPGSRPAL